jgi:hypothetical protein
MINFLGSASKEVLQAIEACDSKLGRQSPMKLSYFLDTSFISLPQHHKLTVVDAIANNNVLYARKPTVCKF